MAQSDYTHYRLFSIPTDVIIEVDGIPAIENTWYLNTLDIIAKKVNADDYGEPFAILMYQTTDGSVESELTPIKINLEVNIGTPASANKVVTVLNNTTTNLELELPINDSTDRIQIINFDPTGKLFLGNSIVSKGQEILRKDLSNLDFQSGIKGFSDTYNEIEYLCGNKNGFDTTKYICTIKITGTASLVLENTGILVSDVDFYEQNFYLKIVNGIPEGIANIKLDVAFDGLAGVNTYIQTSRTNDTKYINGISNINLTIDSISGELKFSIKTIIDIIDVPETGTITVTLLDIDGDPLNVSGINEIIATLNIV